MSTGEGDIVDYKITERAQTVKFAPTYERPERTRRQTRQRDMKKSTWEKPPNLDQVIRKDYLAIKGVDNIQIDSLKKS